MWVTEIQEYVRSRKVFQNAIDRQQTKFSWSYTEYEIQLLYWFLAAFQLYDLVLYLLTAALHEIHLTLLFLATQMLCQVACLLPFFPYFPLGSTIPWNIFLFPICSSTFILSSCLSISIARLALTNSYWPSSTSKNPQKIKKRSICCR